MESFRSVIRILSLNFLRPIITCGHLKTIMYYQCISTAEMNPTKRLDADGRVPSRAQADETAASPDGDDR